MNILLFTERLGISQSVSIKAAPILSILATLFLAMPLLGGYVGYQMADSASDEMDRAADQRTSSAEYWQQQMKQQRIELSHAKRDAEESLSALTLRLGQLQAHTMRLNAMGERMTQIAGLDNGEFNFQQPPAQGGPANPTELTAVSVPDFLIQFDAVNKTLDDREQQLGLLSMMMINRDLLSEVSPSGRPSAKGWISSRYGKRTDPFTGKSDHHKGVDIAWKEGSEIVAVASGVVSWAGYRSGYGKVVEIDHGDGTTTRYGHNKKNLVGVGEVVRKGQQIAEMGSSGRSTGPHVHYELIRNGKTVNPMKYLKSTG